MDDYELDEIKKRKIQELQRQIQQNQEDQIKEQLELQQQLEALEVVVKTRLTKEALQRYGNIKAAHPEKAMQLLVIIGQALQEGFTGIINDEQLKEILRKITPEKKDFNLKIK